MVSAALAVEACQAPPIDVQTATGVVTRVDGPTVAQVDSFTLRTPEGVSVNFAVDTLAVDGGGKPAPHLREHLVSGEPILVEYHVEEGQAIAIRYRDAPR